jgi:hypothetical protein
MIKRALFFTVLSLLAASSFAQNVHHSKLFIDGTAVRTDHYEFFMKNFTLEAEGAGYTVTRTRDEAAYTLNFNVSANTSGNNYQYIAKISLLKNVDGLEVTTLDFFYNYIEEAYEYTRTLFQSITLYIPIYTTEELSAAQGRFDNWKNKWIYLRASFDYPITFYELKGDGLKAGALFNPKSNQMDPLDNIIWSMPGATVGLEFQFLDFMSIELNFQLSIGMNDLRDYLFINMAAGLELKFPIKFDNIMLVPYGAFIYPLNISPVFSEFPLFAFGPGIQLCARAGRYGAVFIDVNYTFSLTDTVMHNPHLATPEPFAPEPRVINYNRSVIGIGIGYKFGLFDR